MTNITNEIKIESAVNIIPFEPESKQITFIDSFKRFNEAAEILNSKTIGIQIEINRKITQAIAFSDSKIDLDDYKWILGENMKASSISRENFELQSERFCYAVIQNQQSNCSCRYTDSSLLSVLQENGIVLQLYFTASNGEANTIMLLYSPIELPLRTQIMLWDGKCYYIYDDGGYGLYCDNFATQKEVAKLYSGNNYHGNTVKNDRACIWDRTIRIYDLNGQLISEFNPEDVSVADYLAFDSDNISEKLILTNNEDVIFYDKCAEAFRIIKKN